MYIYCHYNLRAIIPVLHNVSRIVSVKETVIVRREKAISILQCYAVLYGTKNGTFANMKIVRIYIYMYVCILEVCMYVHEQNFKKRRVKRVATDKSITDR